MWCLQSYAPLLFMCFRPHEQHTPEEKVVIVLPGCTFKNTKTTFTGVSDSNIITKQILLIMMHLLLLTESINPSQERDAMKGSNGFLVIFFIFILQGRYLIGKDFWFQLHSPLQLAGMGFLSGRNSVSLFMCSTYQIPQLCQTPCP